jgi:NTP pyrophosphatase (non-canonical NTP hydrolase)
MSITFEEYQARTSDTAVYPGSEYRVQPNQALTGQGTVAVLYLLCGLVSELGEVAGKIKKIIRDNGGVFSPEALTEISKEGGDIEWYLSELATLFGWSRGESAQANLDKLASRKARGVLQGSGDNR